MGSQKSKRSIARIRGRVILFVISVILVAAVFCGVGAGYIFLSTRLHGFSFPDTYTYRVGMDSTSDSHLKTLTYKLGAVSDTQVPYIDFTALQEYCDFYESGDSKQFRYILPSDQSQFTVTDGSRRAEVNGNIIYLEAPAVKSGASLYLPLSFIDLYVGGITVEESDEQDDEFTYIIRFNEEKEYRLLLGENSPCPPIDTSVLN